MADTQKFLNLCGEANTQVDLAARRFSAWLSSLCLPYNGAWNAHTSFLKEAGQAAQLANDILIQAALAFFPGGVGGIVGNAMKNLGNGVAIVDGIKDVSKWFLRSGAMAGLPGATSTGVPTQFKAFPPNPTEWEHCVNMRVQSELAIVTECIANWQHSVNKADSTFRADFDPTKRIADALFITQPALDELAAAATRVTEWKQRVSGSSKSISSQATATASVMAPTASVAGNALALKDLRPVSRESWQTQFERGFILSWIDSYAAGVAGRSNMIANSSLIRSLDSYGMSISLPRLGDFFVSVANQKLREAQNARTKARGRLSIFDLGMPIMR